MNELTAEYTKAVDLDRRIKVSAQLAQQNLYEVCKGLKEMRDGKLYKELGYQNFEDYCENEVGIKKVQAYKYIAIASMENVQSTERLGTEKLFLLAKLDEPQREEIQQTVDLESTTVKELKEKIDSLKKANDRLMGKVEEAEKTAEKSRKSEEAACGKLSILQTDAEFQKQKITQLESEISRKEESITALEEQVEELENRPIDVAVADNTEEINNIKAELAHQHEEELNNLKAEYEKRISEAENRPAEVKTDNKEVFRAYLSNAVDSAKRLLEFISNNPDELYKTKAKELFEGMLKKVKE